MKNSEQVIEDMIALRSCVNRYIGIHYQCNNYNASRTCEVLFERINAALAALYFYNIGVVQHATFHEVIDEIEFNCAKKKNEFEKITFEIDKDFRDAKKELFGFLRALQGITDLECDNILKVQEFCIEFVDLIDEVIKYSNLK